MTEADPAGRKNVLMSRKQIHTYYGKYTEQLDCILSWPLLYIEIGQSIS